jgi:hypothetical protein
LAKGGTLVARDARDVDGQSPDILIG